jgi:hypothetical protein
LRVERWLPTKQARQTPWFWFYFDDFLANSRDKPLFSNFRIVKAGELLRESPAICFDAGIEESLDVAQGFF